MKLLIIIVCLLASSQLFSSQQVLILATTTSTENSGLLRHIHGDFEKSTDIKIKVIPKGTGASMQLGRDGNADILLVHAPDQEREFILNGYGDKRVEVMHNDFVIIGPSDDPANVKGEKFAAKVLAKIAKEGATFISRGDNSGTHMKEQKLWHLSKMKLISKAKEIITAKGKKEIKFMRPVGGWYRSIGRGMGATIHYATEVQAYTLTDRGTYYAYHHDTKRSKPLVILSEGGSDLFNQYSVIAINPSKHPHVQYSAAKKYVAWITSPRIQKKIALYKKNGKTLFYPDVL
ncbi:MAG: substrate-binding domain-containing protein [Bacteriovoracaceae bacterium]|nr:substrate-binding domain-containing protein [Bacteriovoracaceae bacterium]